MKLWSYYDELEYCEYVYLGWLGFGSSREVKPQEETGFDLLVW